MAQEKAERRINYHSRDNGLWCPWSACVVEETSAKTRCPDQCKESKIIVEAGNG